MKKLTVMAACALLPLTLAACSNDNREEPPKPSPSSSSSSSENNSPSPSNTLNLPTFKFANYDFAYEVECNCPRRDPITAEVRDQKIQKATAKNGEVITQGPDYLTIKEMLAAAELTAEQQGDAAKVTVDWPTGQDYPNTISIDRDINTMDDEVVYKIKKFSVPYKMVPQTATPASPTS